MQGDSVAQSEGVQIQTDAIALDLSDDDVAHAIGNRVTFSKSWWNKQENLDTVQKRAENVWLNLVSADIDLYDYEEPYTENRIFVNIETLISQVLGRPPQPMITEAFDTDAARTLARNVEKVLLAYYHNLYQRAMLEMVARHLLTGFRYGVVKYRWDTSIGRKKEDGTRSGGMVTEVVRPDKVVFDAGATQKDDIPLIAEYMEASSDDLCYKYHDKQNEIMLEVGKSYGTATPLTDLVKYLEVHFTGYHPTTGEEYEGVAWKLNNIVLDKMKNPNYNYDEFGKDDKGETTYLNFFDKPRKPYVIFNFLNQGKYIVDTTSLTEQAVQLQRQLEKRGRQIDLNADMANTGTVYNSQMVSEENVAKLIGDPDEKLMAKGDVNKAAARLPINRLEPWVIQDKSDLRGAIDNIFGVNAPLRGEKSGNDTLGQDELSVQRNTSRLGVLSTALENGMDKVYKAEVQLMKVFFTDVDFIKYTGPEGNTEFIEFSNMAIQSGIGIRVQEGSLLPEDPATAITEAKQFGPLLDPLNLTKMLSGKQIDNPKEAARQLFLFKSDPGKYGQEVLGINPKGDHDADAVYAIQQVWKGQAPTVPESPSNGYVAQLKEYMASDSFDKMNPVQKASLVDFAKQVAQAATQQLGNGAQPPQQQPSPGGTPPVPTPPNAQPGVEPQQQGQPGQPVPAQQPALPAPAPQQPGILGRFGQAVKNTLLK